MSFVCPEGMIFMTISLAEISKSLEGPYTDNDNTENIIPKKNSRIVQLAIIHIKPHIIIYHSHFCKSSKIKTNNFSSSRLFLPPSSKSLKNVERNDDDDEVKSLKNKSQFSGR